MGSGKVLDIELLISYDEEAFTVRLKCIEIPIRQQIGLSKLIACFETCP